MDPRILAPAIIVLLAILWVVFSGFTYLDQIFTSGIGRFIGVIVLLAIVLALVVVFLERKKEIDGGEEDDSRQY